MSNLAIREQVLIYQNVFAATFIPDDNTSKRRLSIPIETLFTIQKECMETDDENRWLLALISDTGRGLSEAVGLHMDDIIIYQSIPFIDLKPHPWPSLKARGSQRQIPLIGTSYWAAKQVKHYNNKYAFSRYINQSEVNSNSASAAINEWLKPRTPDGCVVRSFRHSLRDRLHLVLLKIWFWV